MRGLFIGLGVVALLSGCIDDLPPVQVIEKTRVLGARFEVDGEPERAWPRLDEMGTITWQLASPTGAPSVGWGFVVCPAAITPTGVRYCTGDPIDLQFQMEPSTDTPSFPILVTSTALADVAEVLVQGVICPDGTPVVDLMTPEVSCMGGEQGGQLVSYSIHIERDGLANMNPSIPDDAFTFAGSAWSEPTSEPPQTGCASMAGTAELPLATRSMAAETGLDTMGNDAPQDEIGISGNDADRESYTSSTGDMREDLVFAHYSTLGAPIRQFSVIDDMTPAPTVKWSYPAAEELSADGTLVRFYFTLIDQRGGADWTTRYLCAVP